MHHQFHQLSSHRIHSHDIWHWIETFSNLNGIRILHSPSLHLDKHANWAMLYRS
ncbi:Protein of unknown function [Pyronema omphalodes CBS 100304]|uniref:Uncharacterized protein n=1 Tax=Pyronema omphalodes (strain CBS 100304) TaxID=1076935 RepID=U4KXA8_PYROM|nr:Protein of unknown function [Pyronema omphalodes CBS 100304]